MVLVAKAPIKQGTSGEDAQTLKRIIAKQIPRESVVVGAFRSWSQLEGKFAAVDIAQGEQLLRPAGWEPTSRGPGLLPIPDDSQALSIGLDITRQVAGFVTPGDNVGMLLTLPNGDGSNKTKFLLQNVRVLAVERPRLPPGPRRAVGPGQPGEGQPEPDRDHPGHQEEARGEGCARSRGRQDLPHADATERDSGAEQRRNRQQRHPGELE